MKKTDEILSRFRSGLIVSCQALPDEPLHSSYIMSRMAYAAYLGGALGIRANSVRDIRAIREAVPLPIIGIIKKNYPDHGDVYITPTMREVDALVRCGVEIIALDATARTRPGNMELDAFFQKVQKKYPDQLFMADCSNLEEGIHAAELSFDIVGTTMAGYTEYTRDTEIPPFHLIQELARRTDKPIIAEGHFSSPADVKSALEAGAYAVVVGSAITRPMEITKRFTKEIAG